MEINAHTYLENFDAACRSAGADIGGWNIGFLRGLVDHGLCLTSQMPARSDIYPTGLPMQAPRPYGDGINFGSDWRECSFIVWTPGMLKLAEAQNALRRIQFAGNESNPAAIWMQKVAANALHPHQWPAPGEQPR